MRSFRIARMRISSPTCISSRMIFLSICSISRCLLLLEYGGSGPRRFLVGRIIVAIAASIPSWKVMLPLWIWTDPHPSIIQYFFHLFYLIDILIPLFSFEYSFVSLSYHPSPYVSSRLVNKSASRLSPPAANETSTLRFPAHYCLHCFVAAHWIQAHRTGFRCSYVL